MISTINSTDNKRHITLASVGGIAWGSKEVYNTFSKIKESKNSYIYIMKGFYIKNEKTLEKDLKEKNNTETEIKKQVSQYKKLRKKAIQQFKSNCRTQVNRIKKFAPLKISAKTLGGIAIGLGISLLIDYIKDKKKK